MTTRTDILESLGVGGDDDSPLDHMFRSMASATQAWKCNRCGEWLCNDCVCSIVIEQSGKGGMAGSIEHDGCGGMFKAPK